MSAVSAAERGVPLRRFRTRGLSDLQPSVGRKNLFQTFPARVIHRLKKVQINRYNLRSMTSEQVINRDLELFPCWFRFMLIAKTFPAVPDFHSVSTPTTQVLSLTDQP